MKIIIIGAGWYGLHSYTFLKSNLKDYVCWDAHYKVELIDKYMNDLLGKKQLAPNWFKNNIYL